MLVVRLMVVALGAMATCTATAAPYTLIEIGVLPGDSFSSAQAINDHGQVVGTSSSGTETRAYLWDNGTITDLGDLPGALNLSGASDINNDGQVVGTSQTAAGGRTFFWSNGTMIDVAARPTGTPGFAAINDAGEVVGTTRGSMSERAFIWDSGLITSLGSLPGASDTFAFDVNNHGQVVGSARTLAGPRAVLWDLRDGLFGLGTITDLGILTGRDDFTTARGITNTGFIIGQITNATSERAALWDGDQLIDLGVLGVLPDGTEYSIALGINDVGHVVGSSGTASGIRAMVWDRDSGMRDLNDLIDPALGWSLISAQGINDSGQIVGFGFNGTANRAFVLTPASTTTPVPLPAGLPLLAAALGGLAWMRRRG